MGEKNATHINELSEINEFFRTHQGQSVQVWRYHVSHCWLELLIQHSGHPAGSPDAVTYTTINCHMTYAMRFPAMAWELHLSASEESDPTHGDVIRLVDDAAGVQIDCSQLGLVVGHHPGL